MRSLFKLFNNKCFDLKRFPLGKRSSPKVFNAIHRFSEDVDITPDYKSFDVGIEGDLLSASKSKRKSISDELKKKVKEYSNDVIRPKLDASIKEISSEYTLVVDDSGEKGLIILC